MFSKKYIFVREDVIIDFLDFLMELFCFDLEIYVVGFIGLVSNLNRI